MTQEFSGFRWSRRVGKSITRRLNARRARLTNLWSVEQNDGEWRGVPPDYPADAATRDVGEFIAWRGAFPCSIQFNSRIDALIEDLANALCLAWALHRDVTGAASDPQVRKNLRLLLAEPEKIRDRIWKIDPNTRGIIETFLPAGSRILETAEHTDDQLRATVEAALISMRIPQRGRPASSVDYASHFLGERLAEIFEKYSGQRPTRRVHPETHVEYGPFHDFVAIVLSVVPRRLLQYKSARSGSITKSVDHVVRLGVESRGTPAATHAP